MKIAVLNLYSDLVNRGAESFISDFVTEISKKHGVKLFSGRDAEINDPALPQQGFYGSFIQNFRKRLFIDPANIQVLWFSLKIFPDLVKNKYDLLIPVNGFWQVILCHMVKLLSGGKILITGHSGPGWDERWNLLLKPDVFVASTPELAVWAKKSAPWVRVEVIPYGIYIDQINKARPTKFKLDRPVILCPATLVPYKRVDLAIWAVSKLSKGSLIVLGDGPLKTEIKSLGEKLLGKRFKLDYVDRQTARSYFVSCDIVTLPSDRQESFATVTIEALAAGKPQVVTDLPRRRWTLGEAALYVDPSDTDAYASALLDCQKISASVIAKQAKKYSWHKISAQYEAVLKTL